MTIDPRQISRRLGKDPPPLDSRDPAVSCAVAMMLRQGEEGLELLLILRACHPNDPWSGNLGFPGGKREATDPSLRHAAERETVEEIGFDPAGADYLGFLGEIEGMHLPVRVACFVYLVFGDPPLSLSSEVERAFWVPLRRLRSAAGTAQVTFGEESHQVPCFRLGDDLPVLWGLTYRLIERFIRLMEENP